MRTDGKLTGAALALLLTLTLTPANAATPPVIDGGGGDSETSSTEPPAFRENLEESQWNMLALRVNEANASSTGNGITVAVLSDGVDGLHPDLQGQVLTGYDAVKKTSYDPNIIKQFIEGSYGTFTAAIIAGKRDNAGIRGIAPDAKILPVVIDGSNGIRDASTADGIEWAVANGAKIITLITGIGAYFASENPTLTCDAIARARSQGVLTFVQAANDETLGDEILYQPAKCRSAVVVASVAQTLGEVNRTSNAAAPALSAPGAKILSGLDAGGWYPYATSSSVLWGAAHAAGVAALVISKESSLTPEQVVNRLTGTATDLGGAGYDSTYGYGMIDAAAAVGEGGVRTAAALSSSIAETSIPTIVSLERDSVNTAVNWEAPYGVSVNSYRIEGWRYEAGSWTRLVNESAPSNAVRLTFAFDSSSNAYVRVIAVTDDGERSSSPEWNAWYNPADTRDDSAAITAAKVRWVKSGIEVTVTSTHPEYSWDLYVIDYFGLEIIAKVKVSGGTTTYVYKVSESSELRRKRIAIGTGIGRNGVDTILEAQYQLDVTGYAAGKRHAAIAGSAFYACNPITKVACEGDRLRVVNAKTGKTITWVTVRSDLSFSAVFYWPGNILEVKVVNSKGANSGRVYKNLWYRGLIT